MCPTSASTGNEKESRVAHNADTRAARQISLDELTALCDEMVSLSRAGVPLDRGLLQLANDLPKHMATHAQRVGEQLQAGQSLADVVSNDDTPFPAVYKSVIEAGIRSGRLSVALEGFSRLARQLAEIRRLVISSLVYPLVLLVVLSLISLFLVSRFGPIVAKILFSLKGRGSESTWAADPLNTYAAWSQWFWVIPVSLLALGILWFVVSLFARGPGFASWIPGVRKLLRNSRLMAFTEVLSLLVSQDVPLHQSVRLAGASSGDRNIERDAKLVADQLERGGTGNASNTNDGNASAIKKGIPPFIRWSLINNQSSHLVESLDRAKVTYARRTDMAVIWLRRTFPIMLSAAMSGTVVALYAATIFFPWYTALLSLADALEAM